MYWLGILLLLLGLAFFVQRVHLFIQDFCDRVRNQYLDAADRQLRALFIYSNPQDIFQFGLICGGLFALVGFVMGYLIGAVAAFFWGLIFFGFGFFVPRAVLWALVAHRRKVFLAQMPDALDLLCKSLRAGLSLNQGLKLISDEMPRPVKEEFGLLIKDIQLGRSMDEALDHLKKRMPLEDVKLFSLSVSIARRLGGDLGVALQGVAETIRNRFNIEKKIKALTAEVRTQAVVVCLLPFALFFAFLYVNPEMTRPLLGSLAGVVTLGVVLFLETCAILMMWRLSKIKY
jgi:tight adherence protein B